MAASDSRLRVAGGATGSGGGAAAGRGAPSAADRLRKAGDLGSQEFLAAELARLRPGDAVLSEEAATTWPAWPRTGSGSSTRSTARGSSASRAGPTGQCTSRSGSAASLTAGAVALPAQDRCCAPPSHRRPGAGVAPTPLRLVVSRTRAAGVRAAAGRRARRRAGAAGLGGRQGGVSTASSPTSSSCSQVRAAEPRTRVPPDLLARSLVEILKSLAKF